jgi:pimeloyl-ACP methyl ester carboxylesterase
LKDLGLLVRQRGPFDVVVGHSMGGNLALMLAGALPDCARRLVLLDSVGPPPEEQREQASRLGELLLSLGQEKKAFAPVRDVDEAVARLQRWNPGLSTTGARRMIAPVLVARDGALHFPFDPRLRGPTPFRWSEDFWRGCCDRFVAGGGATVVVRARDGYVPASDDGAGVGAPFDERVARLGARVVVVDGGHHVHVEHADVVAAAIVG